MVSTMQRPQVEAARPAGAERDNLLQAAPVVAALQSNQAMQELSGAPAPDIHAAANDVSLLASSLGADPFAAGL